MIKLLRRKHNKKKIETIADARYEFYNVFIKYIIALASIGFSTIVMKIVEDITIYVCTMSNMMVTIYSILAYLVSLPIFYKVIIYIFYKRSEESQ